MRLLLVACCCLLAGCAYRMVAPVVPREGVRIAIDGDHPRLSHVRHSLRRELSTALVTDLGWHLDPHGPVLLRVDLHPATIDGASRNDRGVTNNWLLTLDCRVQLSGAGPELSNRLSASASYRSLTDEQRGIDSACRSLAENIVIWLTDTRSR